MTVRVCCPAKVNLHLQVLGKRGDGYHELRTVFAAVGVWDELTFEPGRDGVVELSVEPAGSVTSGSDNLVVRAAQALAAARAVRGGARITLHKAIPVGGGLGGGSADAAATLAGLERVWGLRDDPDGRRIAVAAALGADVPFFLTGGVAWGVGRGSEVSPLPDLPSWWAVLLPGPEPIPTAAVYRALGLRGLDAGVDCEIYKWVENGGELPVGRCRNDLQPTVVGLWPEVGERLERVRATQPLLAMLSGSGGTVFGLFREERDARQAAEHLAAFAPIVAPLLTREASRLRPSVVEGS